MPDRAEERQEARKVRLRGVLAALRDCLRAELTAGVDWECCFCNCESVEEVVIPRSVRNIEEHAFDGCYSISSLVFEEDSKLSHVGNEAFGHTRMTQYDFPNGIRPDLVSRGD